MFAKAQVICERRPDGTVLLRSPVELAPYPPSLSHYLAQWAQAAPARLFLAERNSSGAWAGVTYEQAWSAVLDISAWFANQVPAGRTVMMLSDNSVQQGLLTLAAMHVGLPVAPISPAYSLVSKSFGKLKAAIQLLEPAVIFVSSYERYQHALAAIDSLHEARLICGGVGVRGRSIPFGDLRDGDHAARDTRAAAVGPDTVAKLLLTSGSTGEPKAVINTQRMLCASQEARVQIWPFLASEPPVLVDWLPWSHTFGGNHNFNLVLRNGGTLYIDGGRPTAEGIQTSVQNLKDIAPTIYFNVPRGIDMLLAKLRTDEALRRSFFSRLRLMFCAAAALPEHIWRGLRELAAQSTERIVPLVSAWGATETAPLATDCFYQAEISGVIGLPVPGCELKLVPRGEKLEVRVRGANVTPGYFRNPEAAESRFDAEGYYCPGDAVRFVNEDEPEAGLLFNGRLSEDFKLSSGTWVHVGSLRTRALAALAPIASDAVVTGHDRSGVGLLIFPHVEACRQLASDLESAATTASVLSHPKVREHVKAGLADLRTQTPASSMHAVRAVLLDEPPSIDHGEITDKGYINQKAVLERRRDVVARLYAVDSANIVL
ncbi:MAG: feruloyl-CoA synthase [Proteobacteria bacterium]|nr:feruloyl-CoA synthase [Pseudomonadota bacterium]